MTGVPGPDRAAPGDRAGAHVDASAVQSGRTGRSPRPILVAVALVAFLAVAAIKPWDGAARPDPAAIAGISSAPPAATAGPTAAPSVPTPSRPGPTPRAAVPGEPSTIPALPTPGELADVVLPRDEWGVRAIVFEPAAGRERVDADARLVERWIRAEVDRTRRTRTIHAPAVYAGDAVLAFGLTAPPGTRPLAVRIWRLLDLELPQRVVVEEVPGPGAFGVLWRPGRAATALGTWPRGAYRFEVVLEDRVVRIVTAVPTGARMEARLPPLPMGPPPDLDAALAGMGAGVFAVSGPEVVRVTADAGEPLDEHEAWLAGRCAPPPGACPVGTLVSRTVSVMGVVLEPGDQPMAASLELLAPVQRGVRGVIEVRSTGPEGAPDARPVLVFRVDSPGPLSSGLYRLAVEWQTGAGTARTASWHVEVVPPGL